jgi:DNA-binding ferritin-like protein (Dps family)
MGVRRIENQPIKGAKIIMMEFFKKIVGDKKEYKQQMARVEMLPRDYQFVYKKIQEYMWNFAAGNGYDMLKIQYELIDLFEVGVAEGKHVLEITGEDAAAFCDELLRNAKTYTENWRKKLNRDILNKFGKVNDSK